MYYFRIGTMSVEEWTPFTWSLKALSANERCIHLLKNKINRSASAPPSAPNVMAVVEMERPVRSFFLSLRALI